MISIACECKEDITCELFEETMEDLSYKRYPVESEGYKLYEAIGEGYSATVYRALCVPFNEIVAIKVLDLERCNNDLDGIRREVHTMSLIDHPKVLRALCSFSTGHNLWVVMPYMAGGSCLHIMKSYYPEGFEEPVIATLLREALMALEYLHAHGHIHRDVKAGNILLDSNGTVKLADFGVSACMFDRGDRHRARNTFVGTPCWMAPEVMQQAPSYDFRADIWSFGITALELAHGHAPFSKYPPMKVFLMTLQSAPPGLDYERDKRFSKSFKEMVAACLVKDPKKRPSADKLLKHTFFKSAKTQEYLARTILQGLSPLGERYMISKAKDMELLGQNKALHGNEEQISKREYIQGVSAWNFNLEDVKNQAALIQDNESTSSQENVDSYWKQKESCEDVTTLVHRPSTDTTNESNSGPSYENGFDDTDSCKGSLVSFPNQPLQASKGCFDIAEEDSNAKGPSCDGSVPSDSEMQSPPSENPQTRRYDFDSMSTDTPLPQNVIPEQKKNLSGPLLPENVVQHRGRFKVTSADLSPKSSTMGFSIPGSGNSTAQVAQNVSAASIIPSLQLILQQIDMQKEEIIKLITRVEQSSGNPIEGVDTEISDAFQSSPVSGRDGSLKAQVIHLQQRIGSLVEELQRQKLKNAQLERQLSGLGKRE